MRIDEIRARLDTYRKGAYHAIQYGGNIFEDAEYLLAKVDELEKDASRLQSWVDDLQSGMYINCVYCGHQYGPSDEVPASMADVLKTHVESCPKHPMSELKAVIDECADYLKEHETPAECIARNRQDTDIALRMLAKALKRAEAAEATIERVEGLQRQYDEYEYETEDDYIGPLYTSGYMACVKETAQTLKAALKGLGE